jgi:mannose-6-phosphate isomerase-like protein (cupin superfamily)
MAVFPPDSEIDPAAAAAYEADLEHIYGDQGSAPSNDVPGMHRTDTIDIAVVVEGEIWVVTEAGETRLQPGDCIVQRGTRHAWQNRSDRPCTLATTVVSTVRA